MEKLLNKHIDRETALKVGDLIKLKILKVQCQAQTLFFIWKFNGVYNLQKKNTRYPFRKF